MQSNKTRFPVRHLETVRICGRAPDCQQLELNFMDVMCVRKLSCVTLFFDYRIDSHQLTSALQNWTDEYFEFVARIEPHCDHVYQLVFREELWFPLLIQETPRSARDAFLLEGRWLGSVQSYPALRDLPFFMEDICMTCMVKGEKPLLKLKLTYYGDGCSSLGITCCHGVTDIHGLMMALDDLSKLMRNEDISLKHHDRSYLWPDTFLQNLDATPTLRSMPLPRSVSEDFSLNKYELRGLPEEQVALELLFVPNDTIEASIARLHRILPTEIIITKEIFMTALIWLLRGEMDWKTDQAIKTCTMPSDLECRRDLLKGTHCAIFRNLSDVTPPLIPEDYFGNAWEMPFLTYRETHKTAGASWLLNIMASACLTVHHGFQERNYADGIAQNLISVYNAANNQSLYTDFTLNLKSSVVHFTPPSSFDFGNGASVFNYVLPSMPLFYNMHMVYTDHQRQGEMISFLVIPAHKRVMDSSEVLRKFASGSKLIYDDELSATDQRRVQLW